ncbi:hypothetical protein FRC06_007314 [Ceratobasidium sp. 370]|nr:hypothetical protein FRC06_007314 [Ceratobasidium sp. 370]
MGPLLRGSSNQLAPMDMDRAPPAPSSLLLVHPQSPSPRGPPPTNSYATRPSQNNFAPPQGYNGYPGSDAAWEREKASREAWDRESDRDGRSSTTSTTFPTAPSSSAQDVSAVSTRAIRLVTTALLPIVDSSWRHISLGPLLEYPSPPTSL